MDDSSEPRLESNRIVDIGDGIGVDDQIDHNNDYGQQLRERERERGFGDGIGVDDEMDDNNDYGQQLRERERAWIPFFFLCVFFLSHQM